MDERKRDPLDLTEAISWTGLAVAFAALDRIAGLGVAGQIAVGVFAFWGGTSWARFHRGHPR